MKRCIVIGAGERCPITITPDENDLVICADGGLSYAESENITPDLIIGDFDSLKRIPSGGNVIVLPTDKLYSDSYLACCEGLDRGCCEFVLYGMLGGRYDHSFSNLALLCRLSSLGCRARIESKKCTVYSLTDGEITFPAESAGYISVFSFSDLCEGVSIKGLKYEVTDIEIKNNIPVGLSNEFCGRKAEISVKKGTLLIIKGCQDEI